MRYGSGVGGYGGSDGEKRSGVDCRSWKRDMTSLIKCPSPTSHLYKAALPSLKTDKNLTVQSKFAIHTQDPI